jgi:DNA-directed RNA polymerase specialized sigma24 family protein
MFDMFGKVGEDTCYLHDLLDVSNREARAGEPVILRLNEKRLCPCCLQVQVGSHKVTEPQALDKLAEKIEKTERRYRRPSDSPTPGSASGKTVWRLKFDGDVADWLLNGLVEKLLEFLKENGATDVEINGIESGCVKLTLSLPEDQAQRLCWLADTGALDRFGLLDYEYVPLEHEVPATIPGFEREGYHRYLVQRARFLLSDPRVPVRLDAEELASETLISAYGAAETTAHGLTRAEQLACLEKIQDRLLAESLRTWNVPPGEAHGRQQEPDALPPQALHFRGSQGEVHYAQQEPDASQPLTKVPTSGESSERAAVQRLWEGYFRRLVGLVRTKLRSAPRSLAADEEDVALSAFDSFCRAAEQGRFPRLQDRDDLWQLLVVIAVRKAINLPKDARRLKRGGGRVEHASAQARGDEGDGPLFADLIGREPDPAFDAELAEECRRLLGLLDDPELKQVALWKMGGHTHAEIADKLGCRPRTVERMLRLIRATWATEVTHE